MAVSYTHLPEVRTQSLPNETCSPTDYIRLNPTKSLVDAYLCTDGKPAKTGLEYYKKIGVQTSSLYKSPEEHYADYFQNRDPRMKMTLYAPGDKWPGGDDGDPDTDVYKRQTKGGNWLQKRVSISSKTVPMACMNMKSYFITKEMSKMCIRDRVILRLSWL